VLQEKMAAPDFWRTQNAAAISRQFQDLTAEISFWENLRTDLDSAYFLAKEAEKQKDESIKEDLEKKVSEIESKLKEQEFFILFSGKYDNRNVVISIHSGAGGVEAQDWAEMLLRMYLRFCQKKNWDARIIDESRGQEAGIKSVTVEIIGRYAYGHLKSEAGVHRLVRISPFDAEKMRHTSFALVEVMPVLEEVREIEVKEEDLKIDTFRSSGHGGQSVNTTDSAVRITHLPTKISVSCQNERSQAQNRQTAMKILKSKLFLAKLQEQEKLKTELRGVVLSPEWGSQIRSYVLQPYKLVKDHRTEFESTEPEEILAGNLDNFIKEYLEYKARGN